MWFKKGGGQDRHISGYSGFVDLNQLGAVVTKGVSCIPWEGNPAPRIMETASGMINAVGLQNPGVDVFIERDLPFLRQFDTKVIVNICGNTVGGLSGDGRAEHGGGVQPAPPQDHSFIHADDLPIFGAVPGDPGRELDGGIGDRKAVRTEDADKQP